MALTQTESATIDPVATGGIHRLLIVSSPVASDVGYSFTLPDEKLLIGRDTGSASGLELRHAQVSRRHAAIERGDGGFVLQDLDSRNGTFVNGRRVQSKALADGDVIRIGSSMLLFQFLDVEACRLLLNPVPPIDFIVGTSHAMAAVREAIRAAPLDVPTLVLGETGVGKELVALAIHQRSGRPGPFVPVNCSALPDHLVESELFGNVRGAFTGAEARQGLFVRAERGTLFLDEIGEMRPDVQSKLLRALALREIRPVGSDRARVVDVILVAATNIDLEAAVSDGRFREDLCARLLSHVITVRPLRERREDILDLTRHFLKQRDCEITPDAAEALLTHGWPFNVRELEQTMAPLVERVSARGSLELGDLPPRMRAHLEPRGETTSVGSVLPISLLGIRRDAAPTADELRAVVDAFEGNIARVASFFDKDRRQIYRWADAHGLDIRALRGRSRSDEG